MDKLTFRNQIINLKSLVDKYYDIATEMKQSLTPAQADFFDEHINLDLEYLKKVSSSQIIQDLKFQSSDINKLRLEIAEDLLHIISKLDEKQVQDFLKAQGKGESFFRIDFISMLECIGYRYHDSKYLDKGSLKLNLISQVVEVKRGNCDFDRADFLELATPGAIDQFEDAHIKAVYKTIKTNEMV